MVPLAEYAMKTDKFAIEGERSGAGPALRGIVEEGSWNSGFCPIPCCNRR